ncbi:MAG: hypothetical protein CMF50_10645 [Legionellales bacterium]|nr:hypothetical protein [Legionellales bacterium]|tara:strand:- start:5155 stop:6681 length:1527 start_codon:yes stop_codon:yes gene_type:complete
MPNPKIATEPTIKTTDNSITNMTGAPAAISSAQITTSEIVDALEDARADIESLADVNKHSESVRAAARQEFIRLQSEYVAIWEMINTLKTKEIKPNDIASIISQLYDLTIDGLQFIHMIQALWQITEDKIQSMRLSRSSLSQCLGKLPLDLSVLPGEQLFHRRYGLLTDLVSDLPLLLSDIAAPDELTTEESLIEVLRLLVPAYECLLQYRESHDVALLDNLREVYGIEFARDQVDKVITHFEELLQCHGELTLRNLSKDFAWLEDELGPLQCSLQQAHKATQGNIISVVLTRLTDAVRLFEITYNDGEKKLSQVLQRTDFFNLEQENLSELLQELRTKCDKFVAIEAALPDEAVYQNLHNYVSAFDRYLVLFKHLLAVDTGALDEEIKVILQSQLCVIIQVCHFKHEQCVQERLRLYKGDRIDFAGKALALPAAMFSTTSDIAPESAAAIAQFGVLKVGNRCEAAPSAQPGAHSDEENQGEASQLPRDDAAEAYKQARVGFGSDGGV